MHDRIPLAWAAALDVLSRRRATAEPLDRVVAAVARERRLGPREREAVGNLVFGWARRAGEAAAAVDATIARERGVAPSRRDRDLTELAVGARAGGIDVDDGVLAALPEPLAECVRAAAGNDAGAGATTTWPAALRARIHALGGEALATALRQPAPMVLAVDERAAAVNDVLAAIVEAGGAGARSPVAHGAIRLDTRVSLSRLPPDVAQACWPMDDGSQFIASVVQARAGDRVLDLCAGGGGKTRLLCASGARVLAVDVDEARLRKSLPDGAFGLVADGASAPLMDASFDRVLVDAPCSGTGTLRRAPDVALRLQDEQVAQLAPLQRRLLDRALTLVRPGGRVVYATCSLLADENEGVVDDVLAKRRDVRAVAVGGVLGDATRGYLLPHVHGTDGFFVAALERL